MKTLRIIIVSLLLANISIAQMKRGGMDPKERFETMKIGFITQRLDLTTEEAQAFWPVYNKYSGELEELRKDRRDNLLNVKDNFDSMSDTQIEKAVDNEIASRSGESDILKKYNPQFKAILPIRKVAKLYKAEEDFKRHLVDMIKDKRGDGKNRGSEGPPQRKIED